MPSDAEIDRAGWRNLRFLAFLLTCCLAWSFAIAPVALAETAAAPSARAAAHPSALQIAQDLRAAEARQERAATVTGGMQAALARSEANLAHAAARSHPGHRLLTLLTENGDLGRPVAPYQAGQWIRELKVTRPTPQRAATLHLWLGEWELAVNEQPRLARWHFAQVKQLVPRTDPLHGLAAYDTAMTWFMGGDYDAAEQAFHGLLLPQSGLCGYSRPLCALWWRHAASCAGFHLDNARRGIPEPPQLDPFCGAASLAASVRALGLPYDRKTMLAACRVTGEGSSLADMKAAGPQLGVHVRSLTATDAGLIALPKPLIAYVEHDHFVSVVRADRHGVAYLCSDCGAWPGGEVDLTWRQWHALDPGVYAAVTRPGSRWDLALDVLAGVRVASLPGSTRALAGRRRLASLLPSLPALRGVSLRQVGDTYVECNGRYNCPKDCYHQPPTLSMPGGAGVAPKGGPQKQSLMAFGPSSGDPVNLATGEEEYEPDADLTVYNPVGPSVTWGRVYHSLDGGMTTPYQNMDIGDNWGLTYSVYLMAYGSAPYLQLQNNAVIYYTPPSGTPTAGHPITCATTGGYPLLIQYNYSSAMGYYYSVTFPDRTTWVFTPISGYSPSYYIQPLTQIIDRNGNFININYYGANEIGAWITSISNSAGQTLLTVNRDSSTHLITSVSDCYGRSVYYQEAAYTNYEGGNNYELTGVSQVVPNGTANALTNDGRYVYGYEEITDPEDEQDAFLNTITVPSPTGSGVSQSSITYSASNELVTGLTDGNGNTATINYLSGTSTEATISGGGTSYSATVTYNNVMTQTSQTDGAGNTLFSVNAFSGSDPYEASSVTDGNGNTWGYTYDQYGNELTETPPVSSYRTPATTTNTYSYTNFALGELTQTQEGTKTPTSYAYFEPSGLVETVTGPQPGAPGTAGIVLSSYAYDSLGNVTSMTMPGPNSTPAAFGVGRNFVQEKKTLSRSIVPLTLSLLVWLGGGKGTASGAPLRPASAPALAARTAAGGMVDITATPGWRVVYFWSATCPCVKACERYSLVPLAGKYKGRVSFFAVASDGYDLTQPQKTLRAQIAAHHLPYPVLLDTTHSIAKSLHAEVTPQTFVLDPAGRVVFAGMPDDSRRFLFTDHPKVEHTYLSVALAQALAGKPVTPSPLKVAGCVIAW